MVDEALLEEAVQLSGERTYSRTVERALRDLIRRARAGRILDLVGSGVWEGDLGAMRGDVVAEARGAYRTRAKTRKKTRRRAPR